MTAQEIQTEFVKSYLKPTLKERGYRTSGRNWWRDMGEFFITINLQTSQWSSKEELSFRLNIGLALTERLADKNRKKATHFDAAIHLDERAFLSKDRFALHQQLGGWLGYKITDSTKVDEFIEYFKVDLEDNVLRKLEELRTLRDCVAFSDGFEFWSEQFRRQIRECGLHIG